MKDLLRVRSGGEGRTPQRGMVDRNQGQKKFRINHRHFRRNIGYRYLHPQNDAGKEVLLLIPFIQPDLMRRRETCSRRADAPVTGGMADDGRLSEELFCIGMAFEIVERFHREEYPVHDDEQGVEQVLM